MDKLKKNLNLVAAGLIVAALAVATVWPYRNTVILILGALGLAALAAHVVLNRDALKRSFTRKSFLYSGNLLLIVVLVLAILVLANYFVSKHDYRKDFTAGKLHSLSDQSVTVLEGLKADVAFKGFFREGNYGRTAMDNLLKLYAYHSSRVHYEFIDPDKNPGLVKRYDVTQDGTTIIEAGDKEGRITTTSEEDLTNALIKATRAQKKVVYFLEGHGEERRSRPSETWKKVARPILRMDRRRPGTTTAIFFSSSSAGVSPANERTTSAASWVRAAV